jgi:hypothetical protein
MSSADVPPAVAGASALTKRKRLPVELPLSSGTAPAENRSAVRLRDIPDGVPA